MNRYRLMVHRNTKLLGHFESATPWAQEAVQDIARCLSKAGYDLELLVADSERRLLESGPEGIRILHSEPLFKCSTLQVS
ncbi:cytoplasmic protein [Pseudomonas sp. CrR25]|nr:cytoplasmic protein [Pseudomonas sp. CrR25]